MLSHAQHYKLRQQAMTAAHNAYLQMSLEWEADSLYLDSQLVTGRPNPEALSAAQCAVGIVRSETFRCQVISAKAPVGHAIEEILAFATMACADGLPHPSADSADAWSLVKTAINCGLELLAISPQQESLTWQTWNISLHVLQAAVEAWEAHLWLKVVTVVYPTAARFSNTAMSTAEHHLHLRFG